jgi:ADP-ribose pyrophosphatase
LAGQLHLISVGLQATRSRTYGACEWIDLGRYAVDANRGAGTSHAFLAWRVGDIIADDLEEQELLLLSRAELETALANGEFKVMPWTMAVALALLKVKASATAG